jgi:hypothetical protein
MVQHHYNEMYKEYNKRLFKETMYIEECRHRIKQNIVEYVINGKQVCIVFNSQSHHDNKLHWPIVYHLWMERQ